VSRSGSGRAASASAAQNRAKIRMASRLRRAWCSVDGSLERLSRPTKPPRGAGSSERHLSARYASTCSQNASQCPAPRSSRYRLSCCAVPAKLGHQGNVGHKGRARR
jgi:hypothetical protein